jgi:hypothetical protein
MHADHAALVLILCSLAKADKSATESLSISSPGKIATRRSQPGRSSLQTLEWIGIKKATSEKWGDPADDVQDCSLDMLPYTPKPSQVP